MVGRDAVDHSRVPVIEDRGQVVEEDNGNSTARSKLAVGECRPTDVDLGGRRLFPGHGIGHLSDLLGLAEAPGLDRSRGARP